jgi:hypothetical protein
MSTAKPAQKISEYLRWMPGGVYRYKLGSKMRGEQWEFILSCLLLWNKRWK